MHTFSGSLCLSRQNAQKCDTTQKRARMLKSVTLPGKRESCKRVGIGECSFPHTRSSHPIMEDEQKLPLCLHNLKNTNEKKTLKKIHFQKIHLQNIRFPPVPGAPIQLWRMRKSYHSICTILKILFKKYTLQKHF